jgi:N-acetylglucosamine-6-phosphate deacetylase
MVALTGADVVLRGGVVPAATLVVSGGRIEAIHRHTLPDGPNVRTLQGYTVVPGFVDVHVHGIAGVDTLDPGAPIARMAAMLPAFGVTAFSPTTVACTPAALGHALAQVHGARRAPASGSARVLPAHLESNFINPAYRGAQPLSCIRTFAGSGAAEGASAPEAFASTDVLEAIERLAGDIGVVTLAPEMEGGLELIAWLVARGIRPSIGHSNATFEQARAAIAAGADRATHLFNRMPPLNHRSPGLIGAVLESEAVSAELICDGVHVHPAVIRAAVAAKGAARIMAITDGTAAAALPSGASACLGGQPIVPRDGCARLDDGTMAGSVLTMDAAFRGLRGMGFSAADAAIMCASTPARDARRPDLGVIEEGAAADFVVLDRQDRVVQTWVAGVPVYERPPVS